MVKTRLEFYQKNAMFFINSDPPEKTENSLFPNSLKLVRAFLFFIENNVCKIASLALHSYVWAMTGRVLKNDSPKPRPLHNSLERHC